MWSLFFPETIEIKHDKCILVTRVLFNQKCTQYFHSCRLLFNLFQGWILKSVDKRTWAGSWADLSPVIQGISKSVSMLGRYFQHSWICRSLKTYSLTSHSLLGSSCLCEPHLLPDLAGFLLSHWSTNLGMKTMIWLIIPERLPTPSLQ